MTDKLQPNQGWDYATLYTYFSEQHPPRVITFSRNELDEQLREEALAIGDEDYTPIDPVEFKKQMLRVAYQGVQSPVSNLEYTDDTITVYPFPLRIVLRGGNSDTSGEALPKSAQEVTLLS